MASLSSMRLFASTMALLIAMIYPGLVLASDPVPQPLEPAMSLSATKSSVSAELVVAQRRTPAIGWAYGYATRGQAERAALANCPGRCRVGVWFRNACGAIASGSSGGWGTGWAGSIAQAQRQAVRSCARFDRNCSALRWVCSNSGFGAIAAGY
ncbi:MAG: DUF4189 domain-containing protein [Hyphomicrobiaceae bacterium]